MASGAAEVNCGRCKTSYTVTENGQVYRETPQAVERYTNDSSHKRGLRGIFGGIASAAAEATEAAHGRRLREELLATGAQLKTLNENVLNRAMLGFISKCEALELEIDNWSTEGRIKMGRELQAQGKKHYDFNQAESHALWMAGAWLESGVRNSADAAFVRATLDELLGRI